MATQHVDEVLAKALSSDSAVIPRFDIKDASGNTVVSNAQLVLKNPVTTAGTKINKQVLDEFLAASGTVTGTPKALILAQPGFSLFDGALVSIKLFDQLSGAATLNVNGTGAKRIKQSNGDDPEGFLADTWVDCIYSSTREQYIIVGGGGGGNAGLSQTVNLLEEVSDMRYCKVLTNQTITIDKNAEWLSRGVLKASCETTNYYWYMRIQQGLALYEFRKVHKTTGVVTDFSVNADFSWFPTISVDTSTSYYFLCNNMRMQLTPVRNGDAVLWAAVAFGYGNNGNSYYRNYSAYGLVYPDNYIQVIAQYNDTNSGYSYGYYFPFNTINGYYDSTNSAIICALPESMPRRSTYSTNATACYLCCYSQSTHSRTWCYTAGPSCGSYEYGRDIWVISATRAVAFPIYRSNSSDTYANNEAPYCFTMSFTASTAPSTYSVIGNNIKYPLGYNTGGYSIYAGWCYNADSSSITLMYARAYGAQGVNTSSKSAVNTFTYNIISNTASYNSYQLSATTSSLQSYTACIPGYVDRPVVLFLSTSFNSPSGALTAVAYDLTTGKSHIFPAVGQSGVYVSISGDSQNTQYFYWTPITGPGTLSCSFIGGEGRITDATGQFIDTTLDMLDQEGIIEWVCPEDGIYKFIAVGGGAAGGSTYGGGAGYLQIVTKQLSAGDIVCYRIGTGELHNSNTVASAIAETFRATATYAYLKTDATKTPFIYAGNAVGNQGGATGAATASGGGAGGYDLLQYGGQGMNFCSRSSTSVSVSSSSATISVGNIALSKDRNGGVSGNAGACTSGDGYGAGGAMNQNGKDGCLVIIR